MILFFCCWQPVLNKQWPVFLLPIILLFPCSELLAIESVITLNGHNNEFTEFSIGSLVDNEGSLSVESILQRPFQPVKNQSSQPAANQVVWYQFVIHNDSSTEKLFYLHNRQPLFSRQIDIYQFNGNKQLEQKHYTLLEANVGAILTGSSIITPIKLTPGERRSIYIRNHALIHQVIDLALYDHDASLQSLINKNNLSNLLLTMMLSLALYNIMLFLFIRKIVFFYYALYLLNATLGLFYLYGVPLHNLNIYVEAIYWLNLTAIWVAPFLLLFFRAVFDTTHQHPTLNRWFNGVIALAVINTLLVIPFDLWFAMQWVSAIFIFSFIVLLVAIIHLLRNRHPLAPLFTIAYGLYLVCMSLTLFALEGRIPFNNLTLHASGIGLVIEATLFSYLLHYHLKSLEREVESKRDQLILNHKKAQLGEMLGAIVHQWKQPLNAMSSTVTLLFYRLQDREPVNHDELKTKLEQIDSQIIFLNETLDYFRHFFNPSRDGEQAALEQIINSVADLTREEMLAANIELTTEIHLTLPFHTNRNDLVHVLLNLLHNARAACEHSNSSERMIKIVAMTSNDNKVFLDVIDNGKGIEHKLLAHLFDEYSSTKTEQSNQGLGLYITRNILEQHLNATIEARPLPQGSQFRITLCQPS